MHAALDHPGGGFRGEEGDLLAFAEANVMGTLRLIEAARNAGVGRFIFISTCAVHDRILPDRPLDETHPLWMSNHYGAHKAAIEAFVHSFGFGHGWPICALRPTGIYGLAHPARNSKWYSLVRDVAEGKPVECRRGGKEVHARDVARAVEILLSADTSRIAGEAFNCYDRYVSDLEVATIARDLSGSEAEVRGEPTAPRNQIETGKLGALGMTYGGPPCSPRPSGSLSMPHERERAGECTAMTVAAAQGCMLRLATEEGSVFSSGKDSGAGRLRGSATTRSPVLTPERISA